MANQENNGRQWERWSHWLENVFWYHYKWYYFAAVFVGVLVIVSVISFVTKVHWDWTVPYVHAGNADHSSTEMVEKILATMCTDTSGNGRVQVKVEEYPDTGDPGRKDLLGLLKDSEYILFVADQETMKLYQDLGYFEGAVSIGEGLWAASNDAPVKPFTLEEFSEYGYTQEQIDESNDYMKAEHLRLMEEADQILRNFQN